MPTIDTPYRLAPLRRETRRRPLALRADVFASVTVALMAAVGSANAQSLSHDGSQLDSLVASAQSASPAVRAAASRVDAARTRVGPAAAWSDPMLMAGIQNLPLGKEAPSSPMGGMSGGVGPDPMTMRMVGVSQTIPYPGKLSLRRRAAEREVEAAQSGLDAVRWQVTRDVKHTYYELAFLDQALAIVERTSAALANFVRLTDARYAVGSAAQQDVLKARVEAARLAETAASLKEDRRTALAQLNALLVRPSDTPLEGAAVPARVARAAIADSAQAIRFTSAALGARAADSPLPPLAELQDEALRNSPELREQEAMIAAQTLRLALARKDVLPDIDVSLEYGQRPARPDMITATVSVPLPVFKRQKQDASVAENNAQLAALEADRSKKENDIRAEVAQLVSDLERSRAQLALYVKAVIPQSRAALASATASYQVAKVEFLTVLDDQATLFNYETEYWRALTNFADKLAELERVTGKEVLR